MCQAGCKTLLTCAIFQCPLEKLFGPSLFLPLSSNRQHYEIDDCLEDNREDYRNCHYHYIRTIITGSSDNFRFKSFFCVLCPIKVKLFVKS